MAHKYQIQLTASQMLNAAQALRENAAVAYDDERLNTAIAQFRMAHDLYHLLGNAPRALQCATAAAAIEAEQEAIAADADEEEVA